MGKNQEEEGGGSISALMVPTVEARNIEESVAPVDRLKFMTRLAETAGAHLRSSRDAPEGIHQDFDWEQMSFR